MGLFKLFKKGKKYAEAAADAKFDEMADPKIQLEQALQMAKQNHQRLQEQAAKVIANQKQAEMKLHRLIDEEEDLEDSARAALGQGKEDAARTFAARLASVRNQVENQKELVTQATVAAEQAHQAVKQNDMEMQEVITRRQELLSQLDQAKMQEAVNDTLGGLNDVDDDVPNLDQVQAKIEERFALAQGNKDIRANSIDQQMLDVKTTQMNTEADSILAELQAEINKPAELGAGEPDGEPKPA